MLTALMYPLARLVLFTKAIYRRTIDLNVWRVLRARAEDDLIQSAIVFLSFFYYR